MTSVAANGREKRYATSGGGTRGTAATRWGDSDTVGPSHSTNNLSCWKTDAVGMQVGAAVNQFRDWPWQFSARHATNCLVFGCPAGRSASSWSRQPLAATLTGCNAVQWGQPACCTGTGRTQQGLTAPTSHRPPLFTNALTSRPVAIALAIANAGGRTPLARAHSNRSASVWQQHDRQQCSAESQPQPLDAHGYSSALLDGPRLTGSGTPAAVMRNTNRRNPPTNRRVYVARRT